MRTFSYKGYGRIFVDKKENIETVKNEIKQMSEFEFDYLPENFIAPLSEYPKLSYTHKFDALNLDELTLRMIEKGIGILCIDNGSTEYMTQEHDPVRR